MSKKKYKISAINNTKCNQQEYKAGDFVIVELDNFSHPFTTNENKKVVIKAFKDKYGIDFSKLEGHLSTGFMDVEEITEEGK